MISTNALRVRAASHGTQAVWAIRQSVDAAYFGCDVPAANYLDRAVTEAESAWRLASAAREIESLREQLAAEPRSVAWRFLGSAPHLRINECACGVYGELCGTEATESTDALYQVRCSSCGASTGNWPSATEACRQWNERGELRERLATATRLLARLEDFVAGSSGCPEEACVLCETARAIHGEMVAFLKEEANR